MISNESDGPGSTSLDAAMLAALSEVSDSVGLSRLGIVDLDHPGFAPAKERLDDFLVAGKAGEMGYIGRGRDARRDPTMLLDGARSALVGVVPYRGADGGIAGYARAADYHTIMHRRLESLARALESRVPGTRTRVCVDTKPVLERAVAVLAGLGFIGKHGCLIVPGLGSHVLIGVLLTTAEWKGDDRAHSQVHEQLAGRGELWDACGSCTACLDACPTAAFEAPGDLDPRRCISYLTLEHRGDITDALARRMGPWIAGCDECQQVCPYNQGETRDERVDERAWLPPPPGRDRVVNLAVLATIGSNQHRGFVRHTALNRVPRRAMQRNALIALGNRTAALDDEQVEALERAAEAGDTDIGRWARWAAARHGLTLGTKSD